AERCHPDVCKLPNCFCSGALVPGGLNPKEIPQMIMLTFDDAINGQVYPVYQKIFNGKKNPNGCDIRATFFVSHEYTQYQLLQALYHERHEIADHSISHRLPIPWWKNATVKQWTDEAAGMREILRKFGGVNAEDVKGFRAPFLQIGGDNEFKALHDNKFTYETSMPTQQNNPPLWPYTLEYASTQECVIPPCPTGSYPGLWEVPMVDYRGLHGELCNMIDGCNPPTTADDAYNLIKSNFERHYNSNRAPFPMFMHASWFLSYPFALEGYQRFLTEALSQGDVYFVTVSQAIEWIKTPTPLEKIKTFAPWQCDKPAPPAPCEDVNVCSYPDRARYLWTCTRPCPAHYPWTGNPDGN
ncbi:predicted protein, partial [Nematostella vectensis]